MKKNNLISHVFKFILFLFFTASYTHAAEDTEINSEASKQDDNQIIITARKRAERLLDVPDAVTAFSKDQIESAGIKDYKGFANLTPNLSFDENYRPGVARISIRGMITPQVGDPPIAHVVDGITAPSTDFINQELFTVERIEVLKGPQGALYGKGAVAGAINITTRQPTDEFEGFVAMGAAEGGSNQVSALISGPLVDDSVLFQFGASFSERDGFIKNENLGKMTDFNDNTYVQGMLKFLIDEETSLDLRIKTADTTTGIANYSLVDFDADFNIGFDDILPSANILGTNDREILEVSAKFDMETDAGDLIIVAGYNESDSISYSDLDHTNFPTDFDAFFFAGAQETLFKVESYTSEIRFSSNNDSALQWQVGAFFQSKKLNSTFNQWDDWDGVGERLRNSFTIPEDEFLGDNLDPFFETEYLLSVIDENKSDSWALFTQLNYDVTDDFEASFALRYDTDKRQSFDWRFKSDTLASKTFSQVQPKLQLSYHFDKDVMAYFSASTGFRSGGFNEPHPDIVRIFEKEVSKNTELGLKSSLLDGKITFNAALFHSDIDDTQFTRFNIDTFTLENLGIDETTTDGYEIETVFNATDDLRLSASYGYVDAEIVKFTADPNLGDLNGNVVPGVYKSNFNLGIEYFIPVTNNMDVQFRLDYLKNGTVNWDLENYLQTPSTAFVNLRISLMAEQFTITLFADNLTDERMPSDAYYLDYGIARQPNRPRYYGIEGRFNFY